MLSSASDGAAPHARIVAASIPALAQSANPTAIGLTHMIQIEVNFK